MSADVLRPFNILAVDDQEVLNEIVAEYLAEDLHHVETAFDGRRGDGEVPDGIVRPGDHGHGDAGDGRRGTGRGREGDGRRRRG